MKKQFTRFAFGLTCMVIVIGAPIVAQSSADSPREIPTAGYRPMTETERLAFNARNMEAARSVAESSRPSPSETKPVETFFVQGRENVRDAGLMKLIDYMKVHANRSSSELTGEAFIGFWTSGHEKPVESINFNGTSQTGIHYSLVVRKYPNAIPDDLMAGIEGRTTFSALDVSEAMEPTQTLPAGTRSTAFKGRFGAQVIAMQGSYYITVVVNRPNPNLAAAFARRILDQMK